MNGIAESSEQHLKNNETLLRAILDNVLDGIITINERGVVESFNQSAEKIFGYKADEVIGNNVKMLMPEPYHTQHDGYLHNFVSTGRKKIIGIGREVVGLRKDGSTFPMDLAVSEMTMGERRMFTGIVRDITERNLAIQELRENETRMSAILDNVLDGIITINERGNIESFNKAAIQIFGYSEAEVFGQNIKMLMPEPYHSEHDGYLHNFVSTGKKKIIGLGRQVVGQRKDGSTFPMDLAVSEMVLGDKRMFTGIVRDITERVKVERMKSEFISTVSHELRTPLTSIRGSLALIVGGVVGELPAKARPLIDIAHKNSERLILLVNDILDMEKIEAGKMEFDLQPVELMPLLKQALDGNCAYAELFRVSYELESELPEVAVQVDPNRLMQVFANLLSNAAKFSPAGGKVSVAVVRQGQRVRVSVKDHGAGIPDEFKGRIFEKFAQADSSDTRKKGGTGLGLSITKAIVEQMGGSIGFESQPNVLTEFYFEFPEWLNQPVVQSERISSGLPAIFSGPRRVLHIEDDADIFDVVHGVLREVAETIQAASLSEARKLVAQGRIDLVILDLNLKGESGKELIPALKAMVPKVPIMVFSAYDASLEEAREVDVVLQKSRSDNAELLATVKRLTGIE